MKVKQQAATSDKIKIFVGAWAVAFWLGVGYFILSSFLTFVLVGDSTSDADINEAYVVNGLVGILLIIITILFLRSTKIAQSGSSLFFKKYLTLALWFGVGCYFLIFAFNTSSLLANRGVIAGKQGYGCTTLKEQMERVQQATVPIATDKGTGTAFAVNDNTTLLTAYHVVEGAGKVYANYATGEIPISIIATAPEFDIALLKIEQPQSGFINLSGGYALADSVYGFGYPGNTFSAGQASLSAGVLSRIISNDDLKLNNAQTPSGIEIIQTDAALNPGNSGGALFNKCGVIGVISSKSDSRELQEYGLVSEEGISFAISSKTAAARFNLPISAE